MKPEARVIERFHRTLVEEIHRDAPDRLNRPFTVAEIYQSLVPYRTHRDRIGVEMNGDYEDALLRLLAGEGEFLELDSDSARDRIRQELEGSNPNTGIYREFAAVEVRLNPGKLPSELDRSQTSLDGLAAEQPRAPSAGAGLLEGSAPEKAPPSQAPAARPAGSGPGKAGTDRPAAGKAPSTRPRSSATPPGGCPDCGKPLPPKENLRFCPFCGANPHQVECSACGEVLERSWRYCIACGTPSEG